MLFCFLSLENTHITAPRNRQAGGKARRRCRNRKVSEKLGDTTRREVRPRDGINRAASLSLCTGPALIPVAGPKLS